MSKQELFIGKNRPLESLDSILSILECVLNLSQSFYEEIFFSVGMKFSKSTFGTCFLRDNFLSPKYRLEDT